MCGSFSFSTKDSNGCGLEAGGFVWFVFGSGLDDVEVGDSTSVRFPKVNDISWLLLLLLLLFNDFAVGCCAVRRSFPCSCPFADGAVGCGMGDRELANKVNVVDSSKSSPSLPFCGDATAVAGEECFLAPFSSSCLLIVFAAFLAGPEEGNDDAPEGAAAEAAARGGGGSNDWLAIIKLASSASLTEKFNEASLSCDAAAGTARVLLGLRPVDARGTIGCRWLLLLRMIGVVPCCGFNAKFVGPPISAFLTLEWERLMLNSALLSLRASSSGGC